MVVGPWAGSLVKGVYMSRTGWSGPAHFSTHFKVKKGAYFENFQHFAPRGGWSRFGGRPGRWVIGGGGRGELQFWKTQGTGSSESHFLGAPFHHRKLRALERSDHVRRPRTPGTPHLFCGRGGVAK